MKPVIAITCTALLIGCVEAPEDRDLDLDETEQPSTCGSKDDSQFVNDYDGTLGPSISFVQTYKDSKGALESSATNSSIDKYCSGSLIGTDLFLTAGHCVDSATVGDFVAMNYERAEGSTTVLEQDHYPVYEIVEDELCGLDYAILRLGNSPGSKWGISAVATADPAIGAEITIIGHPSGLPKKIEAGTVHGFSGNYVQYGDLDTLGGSSGSGILNSSGHLVGVHKAGGCTATGGTNSGVRISKIRDVSGLLYNPSPSPGGDPSLTDGVPVSNLSGASGSKRYWRISVPAGRSLSVTIHGGTGDVDLYTRFIARPTTSIYACRPYLTGNIETCTHMPTCPTPGDWYIMLYGYTSYSGVQLTASY